MKEAGKFFESLKRGDLDALNLEVDDKILEAAGGNDHIESLKTKNMLYSSELTLDAEFNVACAPYFGFDSNHQTLFIKNIPKNCSKVELEASFKDMPGFTCVSMSDPLRTQDFLRFGWIIFKKEAQTSAALDSMSTEITQKYSLNIVKSKSQRRFLKIVPNLTLKRLKEHIDLSAKLISALDLASGIENNPVIEDPTDD